MESDEEGSWSPRGDLRVRGLGEGGNFKWWGGEPNLGGEIRKGGFGEGGFEEGGFGEGGALGF